LPRPFPVLEFAAGGPEVFPGVEHDDGTLVDERERRYVMAVAAVERSVRTKAETRQRSSRRRRRPELGKVEGLEEVPVEEEALGGGHVEDHRGAVVVVREARRTTYWIMAAALVLGSGGRGGIGQGTRYGGRG
jgi:hypothetical protein